MSDFSLFNDKYISFSFIVSKTPKYYSQEEIRNELFIDDSEESHNFVPLGAYYSKHSRGLDIVTDFESKVGFALSEYCVNDGSLASFVECDRVFDTVFRPILVDLIGIKDVDVCRTSKPFYVYTDTTSDPPTEFPSHDLSLFEDVLEPPGQNPSSYKEVPESLSQDPSSYEEVPEEKIIDHEFEIDINGRTFEYTIVDGLLEGDSLPNQSRGLLKAFLREYNISLKEFFIRKDIIILVQYGWGELIFDQLTNLGLINENNIQIVYP